MIRTEVENFAVVLLPNGDRIFNRVEPVAVANTVLASSVKNLHARISYREIGRWQASRLAAVGV